MRRIHAFEIHELPGCPDLLRRIATDYLRTVGEVFRAFEPVTGLLAEAVKASETRQVVDLCSGGMGPVLSLAAAQKQALGFVPEVVLTDLFPNQRAFAWAKAHSDVPIVAEPEPVDARAVPERLRGARTMFDAFHHFRPEEAKRILADAAAKRTPLLIVEATQRSLPALLGMLLVVPLLVLLLTPWVRPFSWGRLLFTYLVPLAVPLIVFDGLVSCMRTYTQAELGAFVAGLQHDDYRFEIGAKRSRGQVLTYVLGLPREPRQGS